MVLWGESILKRWNLHKLLIRFLIRTSRMRLPFVQNDRLLKVVALFVQFRLFEKIVLLLDVVGKRLHQIHLLANT